MLIGVWRQLQPGTPLQSAFSHSNMASKSFCVTCVLLTASVIVADGQGSTPAPYVPGVTFQTTNPNYPLPNPFYFEGRIDWNLLKITTPGNAWEFAQRGIYEQEDLEDTASAIADYRKSISLNGLANGTCQIVKTAVPESGTMSPPPCMFTVRLRLAGLLRKSSPQEAIGLYREVVAIDPLKLGVHASIAETYVGMASGEADKAAATSDYNQAIAEYQAELALSPVTDFTINLTGDLANNAHVHWGLAEIYRTLGDSARETSELDLYMKATLWHSDTYPWRITLATARLQELGVTADYSKIKAEAKPMYQPAARPRSKPPKKP
jgi:tetratricopeptide (TPR) repeat protein